MNENQENNEVVISEDATIEEGVIVAEGVEVETEEPECVDSADPELEVVSTDVSSDAEVSDSTDTEQPTVEQNPTVSVEYVATLFEQMIEKFDKKIAADEHKNLLFDKMYSELDSYKKDIYAKMLKPFIMETILLIEDTARFIDKMDTYDSEKITKYIKGIPDDLINLLEMNDVELYEEDSDVVNHRSQRVVKQVETDNIELDNKIESSLRKGYRWNGVIIRPEAIQVYKYKEQK